MNAQASAINKDWLCFTTASFAAPLDHVGSAFPPERLHLPPYRRRSSHMPDIRPPRGIPRPLIESYPKLRCGKMAPNRKSHPRT